MEVRDYAESSLHFLVQSLVLISDGNACARKEQSLFFGLFKTFIRSRAVKNRKLFLRKDLFPTYVRKMF